MMGWTNDNGYWLRTDWTRWSRVRGDHNQDRSCWLEPLKSGQGHQGGGRVGRSSALEEFIVRRQKNQLCRVYGALGVEAGAHLVSSPPAGRVIICPLFASQPPSPPLPTTLLLNLTRIAWRRRRPPTKLWHQIQPASPPALLEKQDFYVLHSLYFVDFCTSASCFHFNTHTNKKVDLYFHKKPPFSFVRPIDCLFECVLPSQGWTFV